MPRCVRTVLMLMGMAVMSASGVFAAGDCTKMILNIVKIEFKNSDGDWITVDSKKREFNVLGGAPLFSVENLNGQIPKGVYVAVRVAISETLQFSGFDGENKTLKGGNLIYEGSAGKLEELPGDLLGFTETAPSWNMEDEGLVTYTFNMDYKDRDDIILFSMRREFDSRIKIEEGSKVELYMSFNLKDQVHYAWPSSLGPNMPVGDAMMVDPPKVREIYLNCDGNSSFASSNVIDTIF